MVNWEKGEFYDNAIVKKKIVLTKGNEHLNVDDLLKDINKIVSVSNEHLKMFFGESFNLKAKEKTIYSLLSDKHKACKGQEKGTKLLDYLFAKDLELNDSPLLYILKEVQKTFNMIDPVLESIERQDSNLKISEQNLKDLLLDLQNKILPFFAKKDQAKVILQ